MDAEGFGTVAEASTTNWEVYKDAFAPPAPSRRVKAWERAPVPAHAPRLQGQKVWKKVGLKTNSKGDDQENLGHEAAQEELERGGMGARKRARVRGGNKEDISNALWKTGILEQENAFLPSSPKKQRMSMGPGDMDAFVVPRKRTNANHLITPRKPGRKVPLMEHTQAIIASTTPQKLLTQNPTKLSPQKILPNDQETISSTVKSPTKASPQRIPLNDMDLNEDEAKLPAEKPVRRRKSLRRSTRRLTRGTTPEQPPAAPAEDTLANNESPVVEATIEAAPDSTLATVAVSLDEPALVVPKDASLELKQGSLPESLQETKPTIECLPATPKVVEDTLKEKSHDDAEILTQAFITTQEDLPNAIVEPATAIEDPFTTTSSATPKSMIPVLISIEIGPETEFTSPTKASGTPRQKRKTPQRQGSRRSARSARANSMPPEDLPDRDTSASYNPNPASSPIKPRTTKTPTKKARKFTVHDVEATEDISTQPAIHQEDEPKPDASQPMLESEKHIDHTDSTEIETENETIVTTQSCKMASEPRNIEILKSITETTLSSSRMEGEDSDLVQTGAAVVNDHESISCEIVNSTTAISTENENIPSPLGPSQSEDLPEHIEPALDETREGSIEALEVFEPISVSVSTEKMLEDSIEEPGDELPESSTPNPSTTELVEAISENAPANTFDQDDTDMLRNFLTRVKANKAAKAGTSIPKRKRSLPHSPIRLPLESVDAALSPSSPKAKDEFDLSLPDHLTTKRKQEDTDLGDDEGREAKSIRRSGRTRLPVKAAPLAAPSFIPVRRLGQDGDNTVTLRRNEEKELAALTRINTRKNKGGAQLPMQVLAKQAEEKEDPASRQRALKEVFDEKTQRQKKGKKRKTVIWAEELAQFQTEEGKTLELDKEPEKEKEKVAPVEDKKTAVKVGVRSKMALGMAVNGTPAPKRKMRGRS
ncbi:hypothetical protein V8E51_019114 [Hyaloscypha variabilis]